jgi:hypothetical protein
MGVQRGQLLLRGRGTTTCSGRADACGKQALVCASAASEEEDQAQEPVSSETTLALPSFPFLHTLSRLIRAQRMQMKTFQSLSLTLAPAATPRTVVAATTATATGRRPGSARVSAAAASLCAATIAAPRVCRSPT